MMKRTAFTLIEMLIVMVIIGILIGLLFPILQKARKQAWVTRAKNTAGQVALAWEAYLLDNRQFPAGDDGTVVQLSTMNVTAVDILRGAKYAPMGSRAYMEFTTNEMAKGLLDPWGMVYQFALDNGPTGGRSDATAYDGKVTVPQQDDEVNKSVAAWSMGPDKRSTAGADFLDDVKSWQ